MGFDDSDEPDFDSESGSNPPTPLAGDVALGGSGAQSQRVEELEQLLAVESAALKEANDKLLAAEQQQRETERKFDQLRSSTSGQMAFMRKKLEQSYQAKLDEMESELEEARDEAAALRLQTKMLVEHIEGGHTGSTPSGFLDTQVDHQSNDESRHVAKLKKELAKKDEQLQVYEADMSALRQQVCHSVAVQQVMVRFCSDVCLPLPQHAGPAMEGIEELKRQLLESQQESERLKRFIDTLPSDGSPMPSKDDGANTEALQRQVVDLKRQLKEAQASGPQRSVSPPLDMTDDLKALRSGLAKTLAKSEANAAARADDDSTAAESQNPFDNSDDDHDPFAVDEENAFDPRAGDPADSPSRAGHSAAEVAKLQGEVQRLNAKLQAAKEAASQAASLWTAEREQHQAELAAAKSGVIDGSQEQQNLKDADALPESAGDQVLALQAQVAEAKQDADRSRQLLQEAATQLTKERSEWQSEKAQLAESEAKLIRRHESAEASLAQMREESEQHKAGLGAEAADALRKLEAEREAWASEKQTLQDAEAAAHAKLSEHAASTAAALDAAGKRESELAEQAKQIATQHEEAGAAALSKVDAALQKEQVARAEAEAAASAVSAELAAEREKTASLEAGGEEYQSKLTGLEADLAQVQQDLEVAQNNVADKEQALATKSAEAEAAVAEAAEKLAAAQAEVDAVKTKSEARKEKMKAEMQRAQDHINAQRAAFKKLQGNIVSQLSNVRSELAAVKTSNGNIRAATEVMKGDIGTVTPKVQKRLLKLFAQSTTGYKSQIASLEQKLVDDHVKMRLLHNEIQELKGNIRVFCRARPLIGALSELFG